MENGPCPDIGRYRELVESLDDVLYAVDKSGCITFVSERVEKLLGFKPVEGVGFPFSRFVMPEDLPGLQEKFVRALSGEWVAHEISLRAKNGSAHPVRITGSSYGPPDHPSGVVGILSDISGHHKVQTLLKESEYQYKTLIEQSADPIYILQDDHYVLVNQAWEKMFGYTREEVYKPTFDYMVFIHPDSIPMVTERRNLRRQSRSVDSCYEFRIVNRSGGVRDVQVNVADVRWNGRPAVQGIYRDITGSKRVEEQIRTSLQEKELLLKEIHHRVKNNLQIVSSLLNLQSRLIREKKVQSMFRDSQDRVRSMALIHEKLYQSTDLSKIDFRDYLTALVDDLYRVHGIDPKRVTISLLIDETRLDMDHAIPCGLILNELVSNAFKHAFPASFHGEGKVSIRFRPVRNDNVELLVKDNGVGMPVDKEAFRKGSLGLQLVSILAQDQLSGELKVKSEKGTEIRIRFSPEAAVRKRSKSEDSQKTSTAKS